MIDLHTFVAGWIAGLATGVGLMRLKRKPTCREQMRPAAWRSGELVRMDEGRVQRGNGNGDPATPKPDIIPKPQPAGGYLVREGLPWGGYQPRPQGGIPNPPPREP